MRADALDQRPPLPHPGPDRQGPGGAGARQKAGRRQARGAPQRTAGTRQPRRAARRCWRPSPGSFELNLAPLFCGERSKPKASGEGRGTAFKSSLRFTGRCISRGWRPADAEFMASAVPRPSPGDVASRRSDLSPQKSGARLSRDACVLYTPSTKITLTSLTLVSVGPVSTRSPVASKKAVASLLSR